MIILAKSVSYGGNSVRYALEKEKAKTVKGNNMPDGLDATSIWFMMKHHCQLHQQDRTVGRKLKNFMVTFVVSHPRRSLPTSPWMIGQGCRTSAWKFLTLSVSSPKVAQRNTRPISAIL